MSTLADRQRVSIQRCMDAFDDQFREWRRRVELREWAAHYTQVHAATALLENFKNSLAVDSANQLDEVSSLVLSAWRVWESFRSRLSQRQEEMFLPGLEAADEIAWACRKPLADAFATAKKDIPLEPPLSCLHGSTSPTALVRKEPFREESAEGVFPSSYATQILAALPFPIISLPWHELFHAPNMVAITHETGHVVERDFGLEAKAEAAILGVIPEAKQTEWKVWRAEIFADFFAMRHCGPAFAGYLTDLLLGFLNSSPAPAYPPFAVRIELCLAALEDCGLSGEAAALRLHWTTNGGSAATAAEQKLCLAVAQALAKMPILGNKKLEQLVPFDATTHLELITIKKFLSSSDPEAHIAQPPASQIAAAAWLLFRDDPTHFSEEAQTDEIHHLILRVAGPQGRRGTHQLAAVRRRAAAAPATDSTTQKYSKIGTKLAKELTSKLRAQMHP